MGFDDFFERDHKRNGHYRGQYDHDERRYPYNNSPDNFHDNSGHFSMLTLLDRVRGDKKLMIIVIFAGILLLILAIVLVIALLPLIIKLINSVSETGLKGIVDSITGFIEKLWKGTGN
jgi:hypothetical protein